MESPRLPRFTRAAEIASIELTGRDREILRQVHRHRFLRSTHIVQLVGESRQQVLRRLQLLYHHGLLERPRAQIDYYHRGGSRCIVYGLGHKGAALLKRELKPAFHELDWGSKNKAVTRLFLEHALMISDVMVAMEMSCRSNGAVRLLHAPELMADQDSAREPFQWYVALNNRIKLGLIPDRVFALESPTGERSYFFLEADRSTMPVMRKGLAQSSFHRKLVAYEATWNQNLHRTRFNFHRFRVLTVTTSTERVKHLVEATRTLPRGHGLFLFTSIARLQSHPNLLTLDWQTANGSPASLLS
jgi:DNA-binding Lrp family transcriptional regulator